MAVLAADVHYDDRTRTQQSFEVINSDILYAGAYSALGGSNHGTAASQGRALPWADDTGNLVPVGFNARQKTGDTSGTPIPRAELDLEGRIIKSLAVTGAGGTFTDVPELVYAIDDGNFTLTRPTTLGWPVGVVVRHRASAVADVYFFSFGEMCSMALSGGGRDTWFLGVVAGSLAASGDMLTTIPMSRPGKIISVHGIVIEGIVDADADIDINLEIGTTNVTGGVVEWVTADAVGALKDGTAVTAANVFHEGDTLSVEGVVVTASTAADVGRMGIYAVVERFLGT